MATRVLRLLAASFASERVGVLRSLTCRISMLLALLSGCADDDSPAGGSPEDAGVPTDPACSESGVLDHVLDGGCVTGAVCDISVQFQCEPGVKYVTGLRKYACSCPTGTWECTLSSSSLSLNPCDGGAVDAGTD